MFTIALTVLATLVLLPAVDQKRVFDALAWLGIFASNIFFMDNSGYFDAATEHHPFLQAWSLAIEVRLWLIAAAFALAVFSWKYVETPFRRPAQPMARRQLLMVAVALMAVTSLGAMGASHIAAR